jgi:hypothetical protein
VTGAIEADANAFLAERMPEFAADYRAVPTFPPQWAGALHFKYGLSGDFVRELADDLYHYIWQVGVNQSGVSLCTSDTPVVGLVHDAAGQHPARPPAERKQDVVRQLLVGDRPMRGIEVAFPVTPRVLLCMYHPTYFAHLRPKQGKRFALGIAGSVALQRPAAPPRRAAGVRAGRRVRPRAEARRDVQESRV